MEGTGRRRCAPGDATASPVAASPPRSASGPGARKGGFSAGPMPMAKVVGILTCTALLCVLLWQAKPVEPPTTTAALSVATLAPTLTTTAVPAAPITPAPSSPPPTPLLTATPTFQRPRLRLAVLSTLKPCDDPAVFDAQLASVASWSGLPLDPPPTVYLAEDPAVTDSSGEAGDSETCSALVAAAIGGVRVLRSRDIGSGHGTVLLGPLLRLAQHVEPHADAFLLINGDILLEPYSTARVLRTVAGLFEQFFVVGRRSAVDLRSPSIRQSVMPEIVRLRADGGRHAALQGAPSKKRDAGDPKPKLNTAEWFSSAKFRSAVGDRVDAEDYFIFTPTFFDALAHPMPDFHLGRPAFDNWLVHAALHTLQPTIDASNAMLAYHQQHDYRHLQQKEAPAGDAPRGSPTYWGSADQKANYAFALQHGGWRHGLMDFIPLQLASVVGASGPVSEPPSKAGSTILRRVRLAAPEEVCDGDDDGPATPTACLAVVFKREWKPLSLPPPTEATASDKALADIKAYHEHVVRLVRSNRQAAFHRMCAVSANPFLHLD